jgi:hypothetical protein
MSTVTPLARKARPLAEALAVPAALPPDPRLPAHLAAALDREVETDPERRALVSAHAAPLASGDRKPVVDAIADLDRLLAPVAPGMFREWLTPVNLAVRNPQSFDDFAVRAAAMFEMLSDLPGAAFTAETRRALRVEFFPSAEDIRRVIEPHAQRWQRQRAALRAMLARRDERAEASGQLVITAAEVDASLRRIEAAPRDRFSRIAVTQLANRIKAEAPELADAYRDRLRAVWGEAAPQEQAEPKDRPKPAYLDAATLAQMRARMAKERRA